MEKKFHVHIFFYAKYAQVREGVGAVMGGQILEYEAKTILNQGIRIGQEKGLGLAVKISDYLSQYPEADINQVARECNCSEKEVEMIQKMVGDIISGNKRTQI